MWLRGKIPVCVTHDQCSNTLDSPITEIYWYSIKCSESPAQKLSLNSRYSITYSKIPVQKFLLRYSSEHICVYIKHILTIFTLNSVLLDFLLLKFFLIITAFFPLFRYLKIKVRIPFYQFSTHTLWQNLVETHFCP